MVDAWKGLCEARSRGRDAKQREQPGQRHGAEKILQRVGDPEWVVRTGVGGGGRRGFEADTHCRQHGLMLWNEWVEVMGSGQHSRATAPLLDAPSGPSPGQQLQQRPVKTTATELAQASEEGSRLGGSWVGKQHIGLEGGSQPSCPAPRPALPCPATGGPWPAHSPPGGNGEQQEDLGQPHQPHSGSAPRQLLGLPQLLTGGHQGQ